MRRLLRNFPISCILALFTLTVTTTAAASSKPTSDEARRVLQEAFDRTNIFSLPSFELKASIETREEGKTGHGTYTLLWNGPDQWREDLHLPGYTETRVGQKGVFWQSRSLDYTPDMGDLVRRALGFSSGTGSLVNGGLKADESLKKVRERKVGDGKATCYEIERKLDSNREVCIDNSSSFVVRTDQFEDREYTPVGTRAYTRHLSAKHVDLGAVEIRIEELKTDAQIPPETFAISSNGVKRSGCWSPEPPAIKEKVPPNYPQQDRMSHIQGPVHMSAVIGADGTVHHIQILSAPSRGLAESSVKALSQWRYEPAKCEGIAVEVETNTVINYTLSFN